MTATIEQVKQFWNQRPCNVRHSDLPQGTREYFDAVEHKKLRVEPHILQFSDFQRWRGRRVLEVGCGIGTAAINFARCGADYTGVELSEASLALTRQRFDVYGLAGRFYQGNAEHLTDFVPVERYDLVYSWGVIHHSPRPRAIVQEMCRYLGADSELRVMVYAANSWKAAMICAGLDQPEAQSGCPIAETYTPEQAHELMGPELEIISIEQDHIFPYEIESYRQGQYQRQPWFEAMPPSMFRALEQQLGWHMLIRARLKGA